MSSSSFDDTAQAMTQPMAQAKCRKAAHFRVARLQWRRLWKVVLTMRDEATTVKNEIRDVRSEVHELTLKQENEQLKIEMLNLKEQNAWLNAAVANMQECLVRWGAPLADPVVGPPPPGLTDLN
jgi:hypothetical protein